MTVEVEKSTTVEMLPATEVTHRNIAFALSYAARMQGVAFLQEEMDSILKIVDRAVLRATGKKVPTGAEETDAKVVKVPEAKETKEAAFPREYKKFLNYLDDQYTLRFNVITNQTEIANTKTGERTPVFRTANQRVRGSLVQNVQCAGANVWGVDVERYIDSEEVPEYHPFLQYFEELPEWDGTDRVTALAQRVSSNKMWVQGFHRWMLAMSAQWMGYARRKKGVGSSRANSVAPILISREQGWGKSTFCRMLVPEELQGYYTDSFDVAQPASCEKKLMDYGLINLDEFDRISPKRGAQLKNLMQMTALNIRRTYQKTTSGCFRLASFIGTSNSLDLLTDKSGSRRFLCVELEQPIDCDTPIEYEQLYAQLKHEILHGERYWFSKEEEAIVQMNNRYFYKEVPAEELFRRTYREVERTAEGVLRMSADEIFKELKTKYPTEMNGMNMDAFNKLLPTFAHRQHLHEGSRYCVVRV